MSIQTLFIYLFVFCFSWCCARRLVLRHGGGQSRGATGALPRSGTRVRARRVRPDRTPLCGHTLQTVAESAAVPGRPGTGIPRR